MSNIDEAKKRELMHLKNVHIAKQLTSVKSFFNGTSREFLSEVEHSLELGVNFVKENPKLDNEKAQDFFNTFNEVNNSNKLGALAETPLNIMNKDNTLGNRPYDNASTNYNKKITNPNDDKNKLSVQQTMKSKNLQ